MEQPQLSSSEAQHPHDTFQIFVNGTEETWAHGKMSYEQAVHLAFPNGPTGGDIRYSVSWTKPNGEEGSLRPGTKPVDVVNGMIIDVRNTDKS